MSSSHDTWHPDFRTFFENCPDLLCIASKDGYFLALNDSWSRVLGYSKQELMAYPYVEFIHPDDIEKTNAETLALGSNLHKTIYFENRYRKADGSYIWLAWGSSPRDGKIYAIAKDVTEIKENEHFLRDIQAQAKIGGWTLNPIDGSVQLTDEAYKIHELPPGESLHLKTAINFYHRDYQKKISDCVENCINKKQEYEGEFRFITAKGREIWVKATGIPIVDRQGKVQKLIGTFQDIDDVKRLEFKLRDTAKQLSQVLQNSPGMVCELKLDANNHVYFLFTSPQAFELFEIREEKFANDPAVFIKMIHPEDQQAFHNSLLQSSILQEQLHWDGRIVSSSGKIKWIKTKGNPKNLKDGSTIWNGIIVDITRETELQEELDQQRTIAHHTNKLAAIGELSAGIGHEINNPLAILSGLLSKMKRQITRGELSSTEILEVINKQEQACLRIKKIVDGLRVFARKDNQTVLATGNLTEAINNAVSFVSEIYRLSGVSIQLQLPEADCFVRCDIGQIQQVLLNLFSNARDALKGKAKGTIEVEVYEMNSFWQVAVRDNGEGIPPEIRNKIFDSFFTTKRVGEGTGLGLSVCKSIIETCGGLIGFDSTVNKGTCFILSLPKADASPTELKQEFFENEKDCSILHAMVVEDEEIIRELLSSFLQELNCVVKTFENPVKAIESLTIDTFDIIFTDIKMPEMDGIRFLEVLAEQQLACEAYKVVISGSTLYDPWSIEGLSPIFDAFICKPFADEDLAQVVHRARLQKSQ